MKTNSLKDLASLKVEEPPVKKIPKKPPIRERIKQAEIEQASESHSSADSSPADAARATWNFLPKTPPLHRTVLVCYYRKETKERAVALASLNHQGWVDIYGQHWQSISHPIYGWQFPHELPAPNLPSNFTDI